MRTKELDMEFIGKMDFVTMTAGLSLILISILVAAHRLDVLRNFMFSGSLGIIFLLISCWQVLTGRYGKNDPLSYVNKYGVVLGISLIAVAIMILFDIWSPIRDGWLPTVMGLLFIIIAVYDAVKHIRSPGESLLRINVASIIGGELLILYGILLHYREVAIIWSPIYSGIFAIVLCTVSIAYGLQAITDKRHAEVVGRIYEVTLTPKASSPKPMILRISEELDSSDAMSGVLREYNAGLIAHEIYNSPKPKPIGLQKLDTSYISSEASKPLADASADAHGLTDIVKNARLIKQKINESRGEW